MPRKKKVPEDNPLLEAPLLPEEVKLGRKQKAETWKRLPLLITPQMHKDLLELKAYTKIGIQDMLRLCIQQMIDYSYNYDKGSVLEYFRKQDEAELQQWQELAMKQGIPIQALKKMAEDRFVKYLIAGGTLEAWRAT